MSISSDWMGALGMLSKGLFSCVLSWSLAFSVGSSTSWECARASGLTGTTSNGSCRWEYLSRIYKYSLPGVQRECFDYVSEADESALAYYYYSKMWSRPLPYLHIKELHEVRSRSRIMLLAGPWWWNWHFGGEESGPLLRQSGQHRFPSCSYDAIQKQHKKKEKAVFRGSDSCHHWKTNWAVGIKVRDRDYILLQKRNRRGWLKGKEIAWLADWLEGKDSVIGRLVGR
jgi:hypothetical protein